MVALGDIKDTVAGVGREVGRVVREHPVLTGVPVVTAWNASDLFPLESNDLNQQIATQRPRMLKAQALGETRQVIPMTGLHELLKRAYHGQHADSPRSGGPGSFLPAVKSETLLGAGLGATVGAGMGGLVGYLKEDDEWFTSDQDRAMAALRGAGIGALAGGGLGAISGATEGVFQGATLDALGRRGKLTGDKYRDNAMAGMLQGGARGAIGGGVGGMVAGPMGVAVGVPSGAVAGAGRSALLGMGSAALQRPQKRAYADKVAGKAPLEFMWNGLRNVADMFAPAARADLSAGAALTDDAIEAFIGAQRASGGDALANQVERLRGMARAGGDLAGREATRRETLVSPKMMQYAKEMEEGLRAAPGHTVPQPGHSSALRLLQHQENALGGKAWSKELDADIDSFYALPGFSNAMREGQQEASVVGLQQLMESSPELTRALGAVQEQAGQPTTMETWGRRLAPAALATAGLGMAFGDPVLELTKPVTESLGERIRSEFVPLHERAGLEELALRELTKGLAAGLGGGASEALAGVFGSGADAAGGAARRAIAQPQLEELLLRDPILRGATDHERENILRPSADVMMRTAPQLAGTPFAMQNFLRTALTTGSGPDFVSIGNLARVEQDLQKRR